jgi:hypothetical protein
MDFWNQQARIIEYVVHNYPKEIDAYINDFLDFDLYKKNRSMFFQFHEYRFDALSNESEKQIVFMDVYIVVRNDTPEKLKRTILDYASAFWDLCKNTGFGGAADFVKIESIQFYDAIEGIKNLKAVEISVVFEVES